MAYTWHFEVVWQYKEAIFFGLLTTLLMSIIVIVCSTILRTIIGTLRCTLKNKLVIKLLTYYVDVFRSIPKIVLMVWIFYALPITGINIPAFETATIALILVATAFVSEIVRSGIEAIPKGQIESAKILGYTKIQVIRYIILPQVFMRNMPQIINEFATIMKDTTLAVIIGVNELLHNISNAAVLSYRPLELYTILGILFLAIILPITILSKKLEFKERIKKRFVRT